MIVTVTQEELIDVYRHCDAVFEHVKKHDCKKYSPGGVADIKRQRLGFVGEFAVSKALKLPWNKFLMSWELAKNKKLQPPDVGETIEVRSVNKRSNRLIVRPHDLDDRNYILVYVDECSFRCQLLGWIKGDKAKDKEFLFDAGYNLPAYYIWHYKLNKNFKGLT